MSMFVDFYESRDNKPPVYLKSEFELPNSEFKT